MVEPRTPRRRRSGPEARRAILDAAGKRLAEGGPEALRLQDIAADLGISHPAILHHFGSRDGLVQALQRDALEALNRDLLDALRGADASAQAMLDRVFETLGDRGHARLMAWRALSSPDVADGEEASQLLATLAEALSEKRSGGAPPDPLDARYTVLWLAAALLGDALLGAGLRRSAGLPDDPEERHRFHAWLAQRAVEHLGGGAP